MSTVARTATIGDEAAGAGVWSTPYPAVPPHTRRGVTHEMVEVDGWLNGWRNIRDGFGLVYGTTRCGKRNLLVDRDAGGFPLCRRCYPNEVRP